MTTVKKPYAAPRLRVLEKDEIERIKQRILDGSDPTPFSSLMHEKLLEHIKEKKKNANG